MWLRNSNPRGFALLVFAVLMFAVLGPGPGAQAQHLLANSRIIHISPTGISFGSCTAVAPCSLTYGLAVRDGYNDGTAAWPYVVRFLGGDYNGVSFLAKSYTTYVGGFSVVGGEWNRNTATTDRTWLKNAGGGPVITAASQTHVRLVSLYIHVTVSGTSKSTYGLLFTSCTSYDIVRTYVYSDSPTAGSSGNSGKAGSGGKAGDKGSAGDCGGTSCRGGGSGGYGPRSNSGGSGGRGCCSSGCQSGSKGSGGYGGGGGNHGSTYEVPFGDPTSGFGGGNGLSISKSSSQSLGYSVDGAAGKGTFSSSTFKWQISSGGKGTKGYYGSGGGGGGGGGGSKSLSCKSPTWKNPVPSCKSDYVMTGGGGGGGGGGGDGGTGGTGGGSGGSAYGAIMWHTSGSHGGSIRDSYIAAAAAAAGRSGGSGGSGGKGGNRGSGGGGCGALGPGGGGNGGQGGNGASGGNGGNGVSGESVRIKVNPSYTSAGTDYNDLTAVTKTQDLNLRGTYACIGSEFVATPSNLVSVSATNAVVTQAGTGPATIVFTASGPQDVTAGVVTSLSAVHIIPRTIDPTMSATPAITSICQTSYIGLGSEAVPSWDTSRSHAWVKPSQFSYHTGYTSSHRDIVVRANSVTGSATFDRTTSSPVCGSLTRSRTVSVVDDSSGCTPTCMGNPCRAGYGTCTAPSTCSCYHGFTGASCSSFINNYCDSFTHEVSSASFVVTGTALGDTVTTTCNLGYYLASGTAVRTCSNSTALGANANAGVWTGAVPVCERIPNYCPPPVEPDHGDLDLGSCPRYVWETNGDECGPYKCKVGYAVSTPPFRKCLPHNVTHGVWDVSTPNCTVIDCGPLTPPVNGYEVVRLPPATQPGDTWPSFVYDLNTTYSAVSVQDCNEGYLKTGDVTHTCTVLKTYTGIETKCNLDPLYCEQLFAPSFGVITNPGETCGQTLGDNCGFGCNGGYALVGSAARTCGVGANRVGLWSGTQPTCAIIPNYCPSLPNPNNGARSGACDRTVGGVCETFSCDPGFYLANTTTMSSRECRPDGSWTGEDAVCILHDCGPLTAPTNGAVVAGCNTTYPNTCSYECIVPYFLVGSSSRVCQEDGLWSSVPPTCVDEVSPVYLPNFEPVSLAPSVSVATSINITFSEQMDQATLNGTTAAAFALRTISNVIVPGSFQFFKLANNEQLMVYTPTVPLAERTTFFISLSVAALDLAGNPLAFTMSSSFITEDSTRPQVTSTSPGLNEAGLDPDISIRVLFDETMDIPSTEAAFSIIDEDGVAVSGNITWSNENTALLFTPSVWLGSFIEYTITIGAATDPSGNVLSPQPFLSAFFTRDFSAPTVLATAPFDGQEEIPLNTTVITTFSEVMIPAPVQSVFELRDMYGTEVLGAFSWNTGKTRLTFAPFANIPDDRWYTISYGAGAVDASSNPMVPVSFRFLAQDHTPPAVVTNGTFPVAGENNVRLGTNITLVFNEGMDMASVEAAFSLKRQGSPTVLPGSFSWTYNTNDSTHTMVFDPAAPLDEVAFYQVAVTTAALDDSISHPNNLPVLYAVSWLSEDVTPPTLLSVSPSNSSIEVSMTAPIVLTFSERIDTATLVPGSSFVLRDMSSGAHVAGSGAWNPVDTVYTYTPTGAFTNSTVYRVELTTVIRDASPNSNAFVSNEASSFLTVDLIPPQVVAMSPFDTAWDVPLDVVINVTFSETMARTPTEAAVSLVCDGSPMGVTMSWSASDSVLSLDPAVALLNDDILCTVSVATTAVDVANAANALPAPVSATFRSADFTAPVILSVTPTSGEVGVPFSDSIVIVFDEAMDRAATEAAFSFTNQDAGGAAVPHSYVWSATDSVLTIVPSAFMANFTVHAFNVSGSAADISGNTLGSAAAIDVVFTTLDLSAPRVASMTPSSGSVAVPVHDPLTVVFTREMDTAATEAAITVVNVDDSVIETGGTFTWNSPTNTEVSYTPPGNLTHFSAYELRVSVAATAVGGFVMEFPVVSSFTTIRLRPQLATVTPTSGEVGSAVVLSGAGFEGATCADVALDGVSLTGTGSVTPVTFDGMTGCSTPTSVPGGTVGSLTMTLDGLVSTGLPFTVKPRLDSLSVTSGPSGANITVTGTGLSGFTCDEMQVGGAGGLGTAVVDAAGTSVSGCYAPWGLTVGTTPAVALVMSTVSSDNAIPFRVVPSVESITPSTGDQTTSFVLRGRGLLGISCSNIKFGPSQRLPATGTASAPTDYEVTGCNVPDAFLGSLDAQVIVETGGESSTETHVVFSYVPVITGIREIAGVEAQSFVLEGWNFGAATCADIVFGVTLVSPGAAAVAVSGSDPSKVEMSNCLVPSGALGTEVDVQLFGLATPSNTVKFKYATTISSISPSSGPIGTEITVRGWFDFGLSLDSISLGGVVCTSSISSSGLPFTIATCTAPAFSTGTNATVSAVVGGVDSVVLSPGLAFRYIPVLTGLVPSAAPLGGTISIRGAGFMNGTGDATRVYIGGLECGGSPVVESAELITGCVVPGNLPMAGDTATVTVVVTTGGDTVMGGNTLTFTYEPGVLSVTPTTAEAYDLVTITGVSLNATLGGGPVDVLVGEIACDAARSNLVIEYSQITGCAIPYGHALGTSQSVTVRAGGVLSVATAGDVTVTYTGEPIVLAALPANSLSVGGQNVYLFARYPDVFLDLPTLEILFHLDDGNGTVTTARVAKSAITLIGNAVINFDTPFFGSSGLVELSVTNRGTNYSAPIDFTYFSTPVALRLIQSPDAVWRNSGTLEPTPVLEIIDAFGVRVENALGTGVVVRAVITEASSPSRAVGDAPPSAVGVEATSARGLVSFDNLAFSGIRGASYAISFDASPSLSTPVSLPFAVQVESCVVSDPESLPTASLTDCECRAGTAPSATTGACSPCDFNSYKSTASNAECVSCGPRFVTNITGATEQAQCNCQDEWYLPNYNNSDCPGCCLPCPTGGVCLGGDVVPAAGFWRDGSSANDLLYECNVAAACPGGDSMQCEPEYTGPLCDVCADGHAKFGELCTKCPSLATSIVVFVVIVLVAVAFVLILIRSALHAHEKEKHSAASAVMKILINFLQSIAFLGDFKTRWPGTLKMLFGVSNSSNGVSTRFFSLQCIFGLSFYDTLLLAMLTPVVVVGLPAVVLVLEGAVRSCLRRGVFKAKPLHHYVIRYRMSVLVLAFFTHASITSTVLEAFPCMSLNSREYLVADMSIECGTGQQVRWALAAAIFLGVYVVGVPLLGFVLLYRNRYRLTETSVKEKYAFLILGFAPNRYYWEMVILVRKTLIIFAKVLLQNNPVAQVYAGVWIISAAVFVHIRASPFVFAILTKLELLSLITTFIVVMAAPMYYVERLGGSSDETASGWQITAITLFLVALLAVVVSIMVVVAVREVLKAVRKKLPMWLRKALGLDSRLELDRNFVPDEDWSDSSDYMIAAPRSRSLAAEFERDAYRRVVDDAFLEYATSESKAKHQAYKNVRALERKRETALEHLYKVALEKQLSPERVEEMEAQLLEQLGETMSDSGASTDGFIVTPRAAKSSALTDDDASSEESTSRVAARYVRPSELLVNRKGLLKVLRYVDINADIPDYARANQKPLFKFADRHGFVPKSLFFALYLRQPQGYTDDTSALEYDTDYGTDATTTDAATATSELGFGTTQDETSELGSSSYGEGVYFSD